MSTRTKRFLTVLAVAVLAMAMYGCSSDGGSSSGISQDMYDALETQRNDAVKAKEDAEANEKQAKDDLAKLQQDIADAAAAAAAKAASDVAEMVLAALDPTDIAPVAPAVTLEASGGTLTAKSTGYTMSEDMPDMISGLQGAMLTTDDDTLVVYTDIDDATATLLDDLYSRGAAAPGETAPFLVATTDTDLTDTVVPILWGDVTRPDNNAQTEVKEGADNDVTTFSGAADGAAGTFSCTGDSGCTPPTRGSNGVVDASGVAGDWTFSSTDPNATVDVADDAYLSFGWWLSKVDDDTYEVDVFTSVAGMTARTAANTTGTSLTGSAQYTGGAAGQYAIASTSDDMHEGGSFTATATLWADFDADADDDATNGNDMNGVSISGMVDDFMAGGMSRDNWSVKLTLDDDIVTDGVQTGADAGPVTGDGATTEWNTGGAVDGTGLWSATFYGGEVTAAPMAVAGEFDAAIAGGAIGRINGAFGATMDDGS